MDGKSKILIVVLLLLFLASGFMAYKFYTDYQAIDVSYSKAKKNWTDERDDLGAKVKQWKMKANSYEGEIMDLQSRTSQMQDDLNQWQAKYQSVLSEKDALNRQIASLRDSRTQMITPVTDESGPETQDAFWAKVVRERATLKATVEQLAKELMGLNRKKDAAETKLKEIERGMKVIDDQNGELQRRVAFSERTIQILSEELVREKEDKRKIATDLKEFRRDNMGMSRELKRLTSLKSLLEQDLQKTKEEKDILSVKIEEMNTLIKQRTSGLLELKDRVEKQVQMKDVPVDKSTAVQLPPIVVSPKRTTTDEIGATRPATDGRIIAINKESNFVIVDLGQIQGVKAGMGLSVYRDGSQIASLEVIEMRKEISACDIVQIKPGLKLRVGDTVK